MFRGKRVTPPPKCTTDLEVSRGIRTGSLPTGNRSPDQSPPFLWSLPLLFTLLVTCLVLLLSHILQLLPPFWKGTQLLHLFLFHI